MKVTGFYVRTDLQDALIKASNIGTIPAVRWTEEDNPAKRLAAAGLRETLRFSLGDKTEPGLAKDILDAASMIRAAAAELGVDPTRFHSGFDVDGSDHEDNVHVINFVPVVEQGTVARFASDRVDEGEFNVLVVSWINEGENFEWNDGVRKAHRHGWLVLRLEAGKKGQVKVTRDLRIVSSDSLTPVDFKTINLR